MSQSRHDILSQFHIKETGLLALINDLFSKEENEANRKLVLNALTGRYCDCAPVSQFPVFTLIAHLNDAGYKEFASKVVDDHYNHDYPAKRKNNFSLHTLFHAVSIHEVSAPATTPKPGL